MKQTLKQALELAFSGRSRVLARAVNYLDGLPIGGWGETQQAYRNIRESIPIGVDRSYTMEEFIDGAYEVRNDRYWTRKQYVLPTRSNPRKITG